MEKAARIFHSFAEADKAEGEYYRSLTPEQRLEILFDLSNPNNPMNLSKDLREFVELLNSRKIKYVLVGGHAVAYHGFPRFTGDVDFFIDTSPENAALVAAAVSDFGFANLGLKSMGDNHSPRPGQKECPMSKHE